MVRVFFLCRCDFLLSGVMLGARAAPVRVSLIVVLAVVAAVADSDTSMLVALDALNAYAARRARWYDSASCGVLWAGRSMLILCHLTWLACCLGLDVVWAATRLGAVRCRCGCGSARAALFAACRRVGHGVHHGGARCAEGAHALLGAVCAVLHCGVRSFRQAASRRGAAAVLSAGRGLLAGVRPLSAASRCRVCAARLVARVRTFRLRSMVCEGASALRRAASATDAFIGVLVRRVAVVAAGALMLLGDGTMRLLLSADVLARWARSRVSFVFDAVRDDAVVALRWARAGSIGPSRWWGCRAPREARVSSGGGRRRQLWRCARRARPRGRSAGDQSLGRAEPCSSSAVRGGAPDVAVSTAAVGCRASCDVTIGCRGRSAGDQSLGRAEPCPSSVVRGDAPDAAVSTAAVECHASYDVTSGCRDVHAGRERRCCADRLTRCAGVSSGGARFVAFVAALAPFLALVVRSMFGALHLYVRLRLADAVVWLVCRSTVLVWWCLATLVGVSIAEPARAVLAGTAVAMLAVVRTRHVPSACGAEPCCRACGSGSGGRVDGGRCDCGPRASGCARAESRHAAGVLRGGARVAKRRKVELPAEPVRRQPEWRNSRPARWQVFLALSCVAYGAASDRSPRNSHENASFSASNALHAIRASLGSMSSSVLLPS